MKYTRKLIQDTMIGMGYRYFEGDNYDVNIIGIRNSETEGKVTNRFDDIMTISYKDKNGYWQYHEFDCTTDPGTHWVDHPMLEKGVAILKPGQYRGSHKIRKHQGRYDALGQQRPVKVYRDNNLDGVYDLNESTVDEGLFGINIHRATKWEDKKSSQVDKWSAGCQVIAANNDWRKFLDICEKAREVWGNNFSYTLIESSDIDNMKRQLEQ